MSNGRGSYATTPERTMKAFDQLPRSARAALSSAAIDWAVQPYLTAWRSGKFRSGRDLARDIRADDRHESRKDVRRLYGDDHPAAGVASRLKGGAA